MGRLRDALDRIEPEFEPGGRYERYYPVYEMLDTILYSPGSVTRTASHVRDGLDYKRMMTLVVVALVPCIAVRFRSTTGRRASSRAWADASTPRVRSSAACSVRSTSGPCSSSALRRAAPSKS
jgi:Na+-transporting NADH:ubiquinone oxidoreductase subunit B